MIAYECIVLPGSIWQNARNGRHKRRTTNFMVTLFLVGLMPPEEMSDNLFTQNTFYIRS